MRKILFRLDKEYCQFFLIGHKILMSKSRYNIQSVFSQFCSIQSSIIFDQQTNFYFERIKFSLYLPNWKIMLKMWSTRHRQNIIACNNSYRSFVNEISNIKFTQCYANSYGSIANFPPQINSPLQFTPRFTVICVSSLN